MHLTNLNAGESQKQRPHDVKAYAAQHYTNKSCLGRDEFDNDIRLVGKITIQINRLATNNPKGNVRKLINYFITFFNVFEPHAAKRLLFSLSEPRFHAAIKAIGLELGRLHDVDFIEIVPCPQMTNIIKKEIE